MHNDGEHRRGQVKMVKAFIVRFVGVMVFLFGMAVFTSGAAAMIDSIGNWGWFENSGEGILLISGTVMSGLGAMFAFLGFILVTEDFQNA